MGDKKAGWEGEKKEKHLPMHTKDDYLYRKQMENRPSLHNRSFYSREGEVEKSLFVPIRFKVFREKINIFVTNILIFQYIIWNRKK